MESLQKEVPYRPLGLLSSFLEVVGFKVSHFYDDLIFIEHNGFLLKMEEKGEDVSLYYNEELDGDKREEIYEILNGCGGACNFIFSPRGRYRMIPHEAEGNIDIEFIERE